MLLLLPAALEMGLERRGNRDVNISAASCGCGWGVTVEEAVSLDPLNCGVHVP